MLLEAHPPIIGRPAEQKESLRNFPTFLVDLKKAKNSA